MSASFLTRSPKLQPLLSAIPPPPLSAKVAKVPLINKEAYWSKINEDIEAHIRRAVPLHTPAVVHKPISGLVASAPRTMAPALCVAAFKLVSDESQLAEQAVARAIAVAAALHVVYAGAWAHEFLPHMLERRGPAVYNDNIELLSGDAIAPLGYEMVANSFIGDGEEAHRVMRVMVEMSRSMGSEGYVHGQLMHVGRARGHMGHELTNGSIWAQEAQIVSRKKEGELYACGAACGAIIGGAGEAEVESLRRYGRCVGTIRGMLQGGSGADKGDYAGNKEAIIKAVDALRASAFTELQGFEEGRVNAISSILDLPLQFEGEMCRK